jgi:hypothetical protein
MKEFEFIVYLGLFFECASVYVGTFDHIRATGMFIPATLLIIGALAKDVGVL